jgi:hypothetical protein
METKTTYVRTKVVKTLKIAPSPLANSVEPPILDLPKEERVSY